jgi:kynurenine formamidase
VDYVRYAERRQISYDPLGPHAISLREIQDIITEEHLDVRQGDILIVRCGLSKYVRQASPEDRSPFHSSVHVGVDPTPELLEWLWNENVAAVAGDAVSFEAVPASDGSCKPFQWHRRRWFEPALLTKCSVMRLHEGCLPGWGMPIGELLDLEELARIAEKNQRWSFFLTVCPLRIEGGASTLANTLAVF